MIGRAGLALWLVLFASPVSAEDIGEVASRVHREGGYAGELPITDVDRPGASSRGDGVGESDRASAVPGPPQPGRTSLPSALPLVGYGLLALAIAALVTLLIAALARARRAVTLAPASASSPPAPPPSAFGHVDLDANPDELAQSGRYAEAITAALIRGLRATGWTPDGAARSRTAREVLASVDADDAHRSTLAELLDIAERVAFGGEPPTRERWDEARMRWMQLDRGAAK